MVAAYLAVAPRARAQVAGPRGPLSATPGSARPAPGHEVDGLGVEARRGGRATRGCCGPRRTGRSASRRRASRRRRPGGSGRAGGRRPGPGRWICRRRLARRRDPAEEDAVDGGRHRGRAAGRGCPARSRPRTARRPAAPAASSRRSRGDRQRHEPGQRTSAGRTRSARPRGRCRAPASPAAARGPARVRRRRPPARRWRRATYRRSRPASAPRWSSSATTCSPKAVIE